ncbi:MAG: F0F1 ATP synthase subunit B [Phycisphaerae bacterium]|nr:F0F1 ATP synthase subunit B [Phycisphaerae bacterium]
MLSILLAAADEHGGGSPVDFNPLAFITTIVVFLLVVAILATVVWPKITKALDARERKILGEIEAAERSRAEAEAAKASFERELASARDEAGRLVAQAKGDAQRVADDLRARSEVELTDRMHKATAEIDSAKRAAINEIHSRAADLATAIASKILQRQVNEADQQRLVDESLGELAARRN